MLKHPAAVFAFTTLTALLPGAALPLPSASPAETAPADGAALYGARCAACHDHPAERIPSRIMLSTYRTPEPTASNFCTSLTSPRSDASINRASMVLGSPPEPVFAGAIESDASALHENSARAATASATQPIHGREGRSADLAVTDARSP